MYTAFCARSNRNSVQTHSTRKPLNVEEEALSARQTDSFTLRRTLQTASERFTICLHHDKKYLAGEATRSEKDHSEPCGHCEKSEHEIVRPDLLQTVQQSVGEK